MRIVIILIAWRTSRKVLRPETLDRNSSGETRKPLGAPLPHFNFARNSLTIPSNFEFTSLKFCGFLPIVNLSDHRITCEIGGELRWPAPTLRRIARSTLSPNGSRTRTNQHRNYWKFAICGQAQSTQQTNCDGVRTFVQVECA